MSTNNFLIAGQHCGIQVNIVPALKPTYLALEQAAQSGSHWARLAVSGLKALSSGRLGRNNIFVRPGSSMNFGIEEFFVILPGCKATVERQPNGTYKITGLTMDAGYFELNSNNSMTGLYKAKKGIRGWDAKHLKNGRIIPDPAGGSALRQRVVGIADIGYSKAVEAANEIVDLISNAPGAGGKFFEDFDLHYTAGEGKTLGGLKNYSQASKPLSNSSIHGSAIMLASTMLAAKDIKGINWVSEFGGAAVLTQAMKILADQGVTLEKHTAFLYRPNTNVEEAATYAHKIGLSLDRKFVHTTAGDFMGNRNQVGMIFKRFKAEGDYTIGNTCWDLAAQGANLQGGVAMSTMAIGSAGVAITAPTWPILASIGTALGLTIGALKVGDALTEQFAPRFYNKHIGKIK